MLRRSRRSTRYAAIRSAQRTPSCTSSGPHLPTLMVGDYNYPFFKDNLNVHMRESGYDLSLSDSTTYTNYKFFKGHFDFVTSIGLQIGNVQTLPRGASDHMPILVTADYHEVQVPVE